MVIGSFCLKLEPVVLPESRLEQKVPFKHLVLVPDHQKHCKSAKYSSLIPVARNRL
jgi:hypothetical protein